MYSGAAHVPPAISLIIIYNIHTHSGRVRATEPTDGHMGMYSRATASESSSVSHDAHRNALYDRVIILRYDATRRYSVTSIRFIENF